MKKDNKEKWVLDMEEGALIFGLKLCVVFGFVGKRREEGERRMCEEHSSSSRERGTKKG